MDKRFPPGNAGGAAGFTLVELLVVIAVVAVLAGLLLPALARARQSGLSASCLSNLRQIALADALYQGDNEGYVCPIRTAMNDGPYFSGSEENDGDGYLSPYIAQTRQRGPSAFRCPEPGFVALRERAGVADRDANGGYGANIVVHGWTTARMGPMVLEISLVKKGTTIGRPSRISAFGDAASAEDGEGGSLGVSQGLSFINTPHEHFRHAGKASVAWADAHVTSERAGVLPFPAFNLGQLGAVLGDGESYVPDWPQTGAWGYPEMPPGYGL